MTIFDYIKKEHKNILEKPQKERWAYFWDYYKWHVIIFVLVLALLIQGIVGICTRKDTVFSGFMLNSKISVDDEAFLQGFYEYAGIDSSKEEAAFYIDVVLTDNHSKSDVTAIQRIMAGISIQDTDFVVGQIDSFRICAYNTSKIFCDLREFLDADTLQKLSDRLYYIDGAVLEQLDAPLGEFVDINALSYPDPHKPETMKDPIPVGIDISDREALADAYFFPDTTLYLGVIVNTPRPELTRQFIDYLWS